MVYACVLCIVQVVDRALCLGLCSATFRHIPPACPPPAAGCLWSEAAWSCCSHCTACPACPPPLEAPTPVTGALRPRRLRGCSLQLASPAPLLALCCGRPAYLTACLLLPSPAFLPAACWSASESSPPSTPPPSCPTSFPCCAAPCWHSWMRRWRRRARWAAPACRCCPRSR